MPKASTPAEAPPAAPDQDHSGRGRSKELAKLEVRGKKGDLPALVAELAKKITEAARP
jgi:hypothetical protein